MHMPHVHVHVVVHMSMRTCMGMGMGMGMIMGMSAHAHGHAMLCCRYPARRPSRAPSAGGSLLHIAAELGGEGLDGMARFLRCPRRREVGGQLLVERAHDAAGDGASSLGTVAEGPDHHV